MWFLSLLRAGEILTLKVGPVTLSVNSGVAVVVLLASSSLSSVQDSRLRIRSFGFLSKNCRQLLSLPQLLLASGLQICCPIHSDEAELFPHRSFWAHGFDDA